MMFIEVETINFFMQISQMTVFKWELQGTQSEQPAHKIHACSIWATALVFGAIEIGDQRFTT